MVLMHLFHGFLGFWAAQRREGGFLKTRQAVGLKS